MDTSATYHFKFEHMKVIGPEDRAAMIRAFHNYDTN